MTRRKTTDTPEQKTFKIQMDRMEAHLHRISELLGDSTLKRDQRRKFIAEELNLLQETNKSAMRVVFEI